jgi:Zn-dependent M28 family amino/carboxypeptidase
MERTVVMLNLDMISRNGPDTLQLDGLAYNPDLAQILLQEAKKLNLSNFPGSEDLFKRSDHYNFFRKGVSAINITSGLHPDYHTVRDNPDAVDPAKAAAISRLIFRTARIIAGKSTYLKTIPLRN